MRERGRKTHWDKKGIFRVHAGREGEGHLGNIKCERDRKTWQDVMLRGGGTMEGCEGREEGHWSVFV